MSMPRLWTRCDFQTGGNLLNRGRKNQFRNRFAEQMMKGSVSFAPFCICGQNAIPQPISHSPPQQPNLQKSGVPAMVLSIE